MSTVKEEVIRLIQSLPDHCTLEQIRYHLYVWERVQRGAADVEAGRVVSHEEAKRRIAEGGKQPRRSVKAICADAGASVREEDIDEARREMWGEFPHEDV
jgi:predicted transcriptional regulator